MKNNLTVIVIILLSFTGALAQNATIKGKIKQIDSTTAMSGVSIYLDKTNIGSTSNSTGNYIIKNVPEGNHTLVASAIGYHTIKKEISIKENEVLTINFTMVEAVSSLSEVVIMTGGVTGIKGIMGSVHYITPKEIQKFSYTDVNRILRAVPGVNIQEEDGFGLRVNIGLRGTGVERSSKITVMEDGVLMAPAAYAAPAAYYFPTIGRMQAIEILKGSSQIKYGPHTTGGAINLISTQIPYEFSGRINLFTGSFGGKNLHAFVGNSYKNFAYIVETFQYSSNGFKKLDGGGNTGFDKKDYLAKFRINTDDDAKVYQSLTFKIGRSNEVSNETYLGLTQEDFNANPYRRYAASQKDQMNTKHSQFSLTHVANISKHFNISTTAYYSKFYRNWFKLNKVKDNTGTKTSINSLLDNPLNFEDAFAILTGSTSTYEDALFVKANNRSYYAKGIQTIFGFNFKTNNIAHKIDFGFRVHQDQVDRFQWVDEFSMNNGIMNLTKKGVPGTESNRVETADAIATYVQYKINIGKFSATPGIRYENITLKRLDYGTSDIDREGTNLSKRSNNVDVFIPGIGFDYQFSESTSTFAGIHKGFSPPGSKEGTKPEKSINYELGLRYSKNALSFKPVIFYNNYSNLLGSDLAAAGGDGTGDLFNGGKVKTKGIEFQLTYDLLATRIQRTINLPISIVYTYTDAKFQNDFESDFGGWGKVSAGDQFPYLANNQLTLILGLEHPQFSFNVSGKYLGEMRTLPGQGKIPLNEKIESYLVIDSSANYILHKNISVFANATNITNKIYVASRRPAGLRSGMPRAFNIGLKATF
ncbi:TonB-dependent receptor [Lutibacter sp.]|uniref:TonB-dependent receptor n=1 Tax=Lutibacter sp. TaxID=1925666 RepID=UPI0025BC7A89|nr:TonB-dependent receptor [Lutibacter sp.]MCF6168190.1 TonB-dependent receptor [Lutibacter sp.]